jgi:hypothetical protein
MKEILHCFWHHICIFVVIPIYYFGNPYLIISNYLLMRSITMKSESSTSFSENDTYCSEEYFQRMLILERKRSNRSGRPFMLILLDISKLLEGNNKEKETVLQKLISILDSSTREIDIKGWYMHDSMIGIICQDVHKGNRDSVTVKIGENLVKGLRFFLSAKKTESIKMLRMFYPDSQETWHSDLEKEQVFEV